MKKVLIILLTLLAVFSFATFADEGQSEEQLTIDGVEEVTEQEAKEVEGEVVIVGDVEINKPTTIVEEDEDTKTKTYINPNDPDDTITVCTTTTTTTATTYDPSGGVTTETTTETETITW